MQETFYAKSVLSDGHQPTIKEHLESVAALAEAYGAELSMGEAAYLAAMLHDFGKYSMRFQALLKRETQRINHAVCGAALLAAMYPKSRTLIPVIEAIFAHHDGLNSYPVLRETFRANLQESQPLEINNRISALAGKAEYEEAFRRFRMDFPAFRIADRLFLDWPKMEQDQMLACLKSMLLTRMLFSCLVDADYSASALDENHDYLQESEGAKLAPHKALDDLSAHVGEIRKETRADKKLNALRDGVFKACEEAALLLPGLFTLTAPTGTGKTLALLNFALCHCREWGKPRIILVLPYLSLTEQSAEIYRKIIPDLLEDTSRIGLNDEQRLYSERWRVPVIITTSVKFFETLFADRPTDCRKLHNIANSVVLFDEAQSLPPELTRSAVHAAGELCERYGCTMVFSTATQPDFSAIPSLENWTPREILTDYGRYYSALRRTWVEWRLKSEERMSWEQLAEETADCRSVCVIVNLRAHARKLYRRLKERCTDDEEVLFLTTDLCPAHRSDVIKRIRKRLYDGLPCRVVSTQCIEAGVDLDFDAVYRALAPLESIIQAAGRCNRNGCLPQMGRVVVFWPLEDGYPGTWYGNAAETVRKLYHEQPINIHDPDQIRRYYRTVYHDLRDKPELNKALREKDYQATAEAFRMIEQRGIQLIVPYKGKWELYRGIVNALEKEGMRPGLMRMAAPIIVSCYGGEQLERIAEQIPLGGKKAGEKSAFYLLRPQCAQYYQDDMGLQMPETMDLENIY